MSCDFIQSFSFPAGGLSSVLNTLSKMAQSEDWNYSDPNAKSNLVLQNYLVYTYKRLSEENKLIASGDNLYFNTGLADKYENDIIFLAQKQKFPNASQEYHFKSFKTSDTFQGSALPHRASYCNAPQLLIYDTSYEVRVDYTHIIGDNLVRFPDSLQGRSKIEVENIFIGAVDRARKKIRNNYMIAIPQYFNGKVQLLIPICLTADKADLALAIDKKQGYYVAETCLTLDMAYNNARLIVKPYDKWLRGC